MTCLTFSIPHYYENWEGREHVCIVPHFNSKALHPVVMQQTYIWTDVSMILDQP